MAAQEHPAEPPRLLTAPELAGVLKVSTSHVYPRVACGEIPAIRIGRAVRFELAAVLDALRDAA